MLIPFLYHDAIYLHAPCNVLTHVGRICHSVAISCWNASSRDLAVLAKLSKHHELHRGVRDNGQTTWRSTFCCQLHSKIKGLSSLTPLWPVPIQRGSSKFIVTESFERIAKYPLERRYFICLKKNQSLRKVPEVLASYIWWILSPFSPWYSLTWWSMCLQLPAIKVISAWWCYFRQWTNAFPRSLDHRGKPTSPWAVSSLWDV